MIIWSVLTSHGYLTFLSAIDSVPMHLLRPFLVWLSRRVCSGGYSQKSNREEWQRQHHVKQQGSPFKNICVKNGAQRGYVICIYFTLPCQRRIDHRAIVYVYVSDLCFDDYTPLLDSGAAVDQFLQIVQSCTFLGAEPIIFLATHVYVPHGWSTVPVM